MVSQEEAILKYLMNGHSLSPLEALDKFGCMRLGARCYDLRKKGHKIERKITRNGGTHYATYWIE